LSTRLTPIFTIKGEQFLLETTKMGAVIQGVLKSPVDSLAESQDPVLAALDFLFQGY
jgi:toxin CcdB